MSELAFELASELGADGVSPMLLASAKTLTGYRVVLYTGDNPDDTHSWVWSREVPAGCSSAVVPIAKAIPGVKAATQAIYWGTTPGPWRSSDGSVTLDPETVPIPSVDQAARDSAAQALFLADSGRAVFFTAAAPSNPTGSPPYTLREGDLWYNQDNQTGCPDVNCKGHALDASGNPRTGVVAHRGKGWLHRWTADGWKDAQRDALICATEISADAAVFNRIVANRITVANLAAEGIVLTSYAEDANGNPTAGAKIYNAPAGSPPIKVSPDGIQIGSKKFSENWFYNTSVAAGIAERKKVGGVGTTTGGGSNIGGVSADSSYIYVNFPTPFTLDQTHDVSFSLTPGYNSDCTAMLWPRLIYYDASYAYVKLYDATGAEVDPSTSFWTFYITVQNSLWTSFPL